MIVTTVVLQFGDGTQHEIPVTPTDPESAVEQARTWVLDNAWLEAYDESGLNVEAELRLS